MSLFVSPLEFPGPESCNLSVFRPTSPPPNTTDQSSNDLGKYKVGFSFKKISHVCTGWGASDLHVSSLAVKRTHHPAEKKKKKREKNLKNTYYTFSGFG